MLDAAILFNVSDDERVSLVIDVYIVGEVRREEERE